MFKRHLTTLAAGVAGLMALPVTAAATTAAPTPIGTRSLAGVLTSDGNMFDHNWYDYDVVTEAVLAVLAVKPASPVNLLTKGNVALTAFIPNDRAFQVLAGDLTGKWQPTESQVFTTLVSAAGVDAIEDLLLYHVVPGATITSKAALNSNGAYLETALNGATIKVRVLSRFWKIIELVDKDRNDINPLVNPLALDINKGNKQIAHGIVFVLRPADL